MLAVRAIMKNKRPPGDKTCAYSPAGGGPGEATFVGDLEALGQREDRYDA